MKTTHWISGALAAGLLAVAGCGQSQKAPQPSIINGVKVDLPKFRQAFETASPDLQSSLTKVTMAFRYGQYSEAVAELEKVASNASLTEPQKKATAELLAQLKQLASQAPAKPAQ
jgi:hypothetical protein